MGNFCRGLAFLPTALATQAVKPFTMRSVRSAAFRRNCGWRTQALAVRAYFAFRVESRCFPAKADTTNLGANGYKKTDTLLDGDFRLGESIPLAQHEFGTCDIAFAKASSAQRKVFTSPPLTKRTALNQERSYQRHRPLPKSQAVPHQGAPQILR